MTKRGVGPLVILAMLAFTAAVFGRLPDPLPTHWNWRGEPDGWSPRFWGAFLMPLIAAALWLFMPLLRRADRRGGSARFSRIFDLILSVLLVFLAVIHVLTLGAALGWDFDVVRTVVAMLGLLFMVVGHHLPEVEPNRWLGIRTRSTLASERVWRATHRLAGRTFMAGGFIAVVAAVLPSELALPVGCLAVAAGVLAPVIYSRIVHERSGA